MKNVQLIAELLLVILEGKIVGFNQDYLDDMFAKYDYPDETVEDFDEEAYKQVKNRVKDFLKKMEGNNNCITKFAKTANNLYPLWALVVNNESFTDAKILSERYIEFMNEVSTFSVAENPEVLLTPSSSIKSQNAFKYYKSSKGASTDFSQRNDRLNALTSILAD